MTSSSVKKNPRFRVGVDTGGTFTDFVFELSGQLEVLKLPSTPQDPSLAIMAGLIKIALIKKTKVDQLEIVHGTTVGTNALLQRKGARTALVTTKGFEDVIAIGRQARPELYNLNVQRPAPLVTDEMRFGVTERVISTGDVLVPLSNADLEEVILKVKRAEAESVAVSLLFSFIRPEHEQRIANALKVLNVPISVSHQIHPEYREYERTSTVVINAYLQPLMGAYLKRLKSHVPKLKVMQSSGGAISARAAAEEPVRTILSGPSGGVVGAMRVARKAGFENLITFDMGGTSTDVALTTRDGLRMTNEAIVAGLPVAVSVMDIQTVGAGGGSIARIDEGGSLRVGPESAGADPGPACYGKSLLPTVTDAHLVLGHFAGAGLLGGEFPLDSSRSEKAMAQLAKEMSRAGRRQVGIKAAQGVLAVVNTNMERALRQISVERGYDPREFALLPFGGAGGLHAVDLARALRIPRIIVPRSAGALSAIGVVAADVVRDQSRTVMFEAVAGIEKKLERVFRELENNAQAALRREGFPIPRQRHERILAMRYRGQSFELEVKSGKGDLVQKFHQSHRVRYGYAQPGNAVEIVSARVRSSGLTTPLPQTRVLAVSRKRQAKASRYADAYIGGKKVRTAIFDRDNLLAKSRLEGPAIVTEYSATTLIPPGSSASVDVFGNLILDVGVSAARQ
jgi:N-methylhydantoinase A